ncbi:MAG: hypothetical protein IIZ39_07185 [Blautia sp.]|nr:hypothetical protein [Blautia sp.]
MKTIKVFRRFVFGFLLGILMCGAAVTASAAQTKTKQISAGQVYYVMDSNISGNAILRNQFKITRLTSDTTYELIFAYGSSGDVQMDMRVNCQSNFTSPVTNAYLKKSASANTGALFGIRVVKGKVKVTIASQNAANTFALSLANRPNTETPIRACAVKKGRSIRFVKNQGNISDLPLIFAGIKGAKITRTLSATQKEVYVFKGSYLQQKTYVNGNKVSTKKIKYDSTWNYSGDTYHTALMHLRSSSQNTTSGWMKVSKKNACFMYPRQFFGVTYQTR